MRAVSVNQSSHEWDVLSCCCHFAFHGGMVVAAERHSGKRVECYHHDTTDPHRVITRSIEEELVRLVEQKLANDEWVESMLEHGARGVGEWLKRVENLFGWDATTGRVPNECYEKISEVLDRYGPRFGRESVRSRVRPGEAVGSEKTGSMALADDVGGVLFHLRLDSDILVGLDDQRVDHGDDRPDRRCVLDRTEQQVITTQRRRYYVGAPVG